MVLFTVSCPPLPEKNWLLLFNPAHVASLLSMISQVMGNGPVLLNIQLDTSGYQSGVLPSRLFLNPSTLFHPVAGQNTIKVCRR